MGNDSQAVQQSAMAEQTGAATDETSKGDRKGPYYNCSNDILAMIDHTPEKDSDVPPGMIQKYMTEEPEGDERTAVLNALSFLRDKIVAFRDSPRDPATTVGKWYVGVTSEGNREAFKSASVPNERSSNFASFKRVVGPFHTGGGAAHRAKYGIKGDDVSVFHRAGTAATLGARQ